MPDRQVFAGQLLVGVVDREDSQAAGNLNPTIPVQLLATPGSLDIADLEVRAFGRDYQRVNVSVGFPDQPFPIRLVTQIDADVPQAEMEVIPPRLSLSGPSELQGLGVEEGVLTVSPIDTRLRPGDRITLNPENVWLDSTNPEVTAGGTATTRIRSRWLGAGRVTLAPGIYQSAPLEIGYSFPGPFLVATLLGSMLGAVVLVYTLRRSHPKEKRSHLFDWVVGVVIGLGVTTMAYAGMKLPEWIPVP